MPDDYATHLPILRGLANRLELRNVLEFGAGKHSTGFFLGLPKLKRLISVETDSTWFELLESEFSDPRLDLTRSADGLIGFDLILIDDGQAIPQRVETIESVLAQENNPPVVVHDAEVPQYRAAIRRFAGARSMMFCSQKPHTALVWPEGWAEDRSELAKEVARCES